MSKSLVRQALVRKFGNEECKRHVNLVYCVISRWGVASMPLSGVLCEPILVDTL